MNWQLFLDIAIPVFTTVLGIAAALALERRQKLVAYLAHSSAINVPGQNNPLVVHTHSVVVKNSGRKTADNVRVNHSRLPAFSVYPNSVQFTEETLSGGGTDIVFPRIVPNEQVTISYLYFPPTTWGDIQGTVKSDEGFAKIIQVLPTPQYPKWLLRVLWLLIALGSISALYLSALLIQWLARLAA